MGERDKFCLDSLFECTGACIDSKSFFKELEIHVDSLWYDQHVKRSYEHLHLVLLSSIFFPNKCVGSGRLTLISTKWNILFQMIFDLPYLPFYPVDLAEIRCWASFCCC